MTARDLAVKEAKVIMDDIPTGYDYAKRIEEAFTEALEAHLVRIEELEAKLEEAERKGHDLCEVHGVTLIENSSLKESLKASVECLDTIFNGLKKEYMFQKSIPPLGEIVNILKSKFPDLFSEGEK